MSEPARLIIFQNVLPGYMSNIFCHATLSESQATDLLTTLIMGIKGTVQSIHDEEASMQVKNALKAIAVISFFLVFGLASGCGWGERKAITGPYQNLIWVEPPPPSDGGTPVVEHFQCMPIGSPCWATFEDKAGCNGPGTKCDTRTYNGVPACYCVAQ